ncbi:MAG: hypothetical protein JWM53_4793 [bacterium]|nr:hypothetical protein [bacterium]
MKTRKTAAPSAPVDSTSIAWCRFVSAACLEVDWTQLAAQTIRDPRIAAVVVAGLQSLGHYIEREVDRVEAAAAPPRIAAQPIDDAGDEPTPKARTAPPPADEPAEKAPTVAVDERAANAAALLGVGVDSTEDEIRAALRARLASSRLHPDHGGDGEQAKALIAAKNLLIERAKAART